MSVSRYFGLPGSGKTTVLAKLALDAMRSGKYRDVYSNVPLAIPGVTFINIRDVIGRYQLEYALILIDEAMVEVGDRDYKNFGQDLIRFFMMHRHYHLDIVLFAQEADGVDKKIRSISERMYWVRRNPILGYWITSVYRVPYKILWPDGENNGGDNVGRILMGYVKPPFLSRLFARRIWRPAYYQYFDSWAVKQLDPLPQQYQRVPGSVRNDSPFIHVLYKGIILLR